MEKNILNSIKTLINLPDSYFELDLKPLVDCFANYLLGIVGCLFQFYENGKGLRIKEIVLYRVDFL